MSADDVESVNEPEPSGFRGGLPRWSSDLPRLTGRLKTVPEDFVVEELPAYEPSGTGEHLFLWIEKRGLAGEQMIRQLARALGISPGDIGSAGVKDRHAVTRQWLSVPAKCEPLLAEVETDQFRILQSARHGNKLRTGHLRGNRFSILVRDVHTIDVANAGNPLAVAEQAVARVRQRGFPNYYGDQRFGHDGETLALGFDLLAGRKSPREIPYSRRKFLLRMSLSAAQSELFNQTLVARLTDSLLATVLVGDVMEVRASRGKFVVEDPVAEQNRCDAHETAITGPMFGPKMKAPLGVPADREAAILAANDLMLDQFRGFGDLLSGTRRAFVIRPDELSVQAFPEGMRFEFILPAGVYATTLLAEVLG